MKVLLTGSAGFIGHHVARRLSALGCEVVGLDSINDYYDPALKMARLRASGIDDNAISYGALVRSSALPGHRFIWLDLCDGDRLRTLFEDERFDAVCHLAAQPGVRHSLIRPASCVESNINGFAVMLEACRAAPVRHLVFASSSSVYGLGGRAPYSPHGPADHPISLYAATKRANELMAHAYSHLYGIPTTGLRFFSVYGPWGRPDMAYFSFTKRIIDGDAIELFGDGGLRRDFVYIDDVVDAVVAVLERPPLPDGAWDGADPALSAAPYRIYNVGSGASVSIEEFVRAIEHALGATATVIATPRQPGDMLATRADIADLAREFGYCPRVPFAEGLARFVAWYREYYRA
ncbi:MAG TPA: NAD-dependent epimerase/dehydratase family protein [Spirochaetota bacterium]|nr:NAD-dependent epimerase/dehydratase family protein [Spirochaetota bacterium]HPU89512.1 NAD-dependent epimerase/dehydratase family protein [Spirochaetota bacterium]